MSRAVLPGVCIASRRETSQFRFGVSVYFRVFDRYKGRFSAVEPSEHLRCFPDSLGASRLGVIVLNTCVAKVCTWRMSNDQVEAGVKYMVGVSPEVWDVQRGRCLEVVGSYISPCFLEHAGYSCLILFSCDQHSWWLHSPGLSSIHGRVDAS